MGITVSGHEDGATKTAMDILYFQQMGYILVPFGISYRTHGAQFNTNTDTEYIKSDPLVIQKVKGMAYNVLEMLSLDIEGKVKGKLVPVCEWCKTQFSHLLIEVDGIKQPDFHDIIHYKERERVGRSMDYEEYTFRCQ